MKRLLACLVLLAVGVLSVVGPTVAMAEQARAKPQQIKFVLKDPDDPTINRGEPSQASIDAVALNRTIFEVKRIKRATPKILRMLVTVRIGGLVTQEQEPDLEWHTVSISLRTQDRDEYVFSMAELFSTRPDTGPLAATQGGADCSTWRFDPDESVVVFAIGRRCLKNVRRINRISVVSTIETEDHDPDTVDVLLYDTARSDKGF